MLTESFEHFMSLAPDRPRMAFALAEQAFAWHATAPAKGRPLQP
jgi:hypothetical protein